MEVNSYCRVLQGPKRHPSEFKELRKQWRKQKREAAANKAATVTTTEPDFSSFSSPIADIESTPVSAAPANSESTATNCF